MSFLILNLILSCSASEPPAKPEAIVEEATPKPASVVEGIEIEALQELLTSKADKTRIFNFWATWCTPCVAELPMLREFAAEHTEVEVVLVSLDMHSVRAKRVIPFIDKYDLEELTNYHLEDRDPSMAMRKIPGWSEAIPVTWIVDQDGVVLKQFNAAVSREQLTAALAGD